MQVADSWPAADRQLIPPLARMAKGALHPKTLTLTLTLTLILPLPLTLTLPVILSLTRPLTLQVLE